jgi:hypothetical protein
MCTQLGITLIAAHSPQAKGRVERNHGTHQDRRVKKLRRAGIRELPAANAFLPGYLAQHNARYAIAPQAGADYHRPWPRGHAPRDVFCLEHARVVGQDYVVLYQHQALQLTPHARFRLSPKSRVLVRETADVAGAVLALGRVVVAVQEDPLLGERQLRARASRLELHRRHETEMRLSSRCMSYS